MNLPLQIYFGVLFFIFGACIGSFLNVVIWRLPNRGREVIYLNKRGKMTLSWPPSHCPVCDSPIRWYQNIPIFSYLFLRARCAHCRTHIPIRYPLVELATAVAFLALYLAYFIAHMGGSVPPFDDVRIHWPPFVVHLIFISALFAASAIDADLFIIPLSIPWMLMFLGLLAAGVLGTPLLPDHLKMPTLVPPIDENHWYLSKSILGGTVGVVLANILMFAKIMPRSFSEEVMLKARTEAEAAAARGEPEKKKTDKPEKDELQLAPPPKLTRFGPSVTASIALLIIMLAAWFAFSARVAAVVGMAVVILIFLIGVLPRDEGQEDVTDEVLEEISFPYVRREVAKELLFLLIPIACAVVAHYLPIEIRREAWLARVLGVLLGILAGGGIVWIIRIGGTMLFNKEAMGMGDAHLMAGVGAILGAPLVIIAFFLAPFLGILWAVVLLILKKPNVLPYGPWLSVASILCLLIGNDLIGWYLTVIMGH